MSLATHQTVQLARGSHRRPEDGVCVMELASMLAGEPFSDRPESVCPVIAGLLRSYNDGIDDLRRGDLYRLASEAVGSRAAPAVQQRRAELCRRWIRYSHRELARGPSSLLPTTCRTWGTKTYDQAGMVAGRLAGRLVRRSCRGAHESALALVERLIACSADTPLDPAAGDGVGQPVGHDRGEDRERCDVEYERSVGRR
jgi:hypothetical protein